jgi:hypothetical protein
VLEKIEAERAAAASAETQHLRRRVQLIRERLVPRRTDFST